MVNVRMATPQDASAISDLCAEIQSLHHQVLPALFKPGTANPFPADEVTALMAMPEHYFFVAGVDGTAAGYVYATRKLNPENAFQYAFEHLHIDQIGVHLPYRRQGCGEALIEAVKQLAAAHNISSITLSTWGFNPAGAKIFCQPGF
jgi:ribosomal protein S18 acetylase RimI-like enzyme